MANQTKLCGKELNKFIEKISTLVYDFGELSEPNSIDDYYGNGLTGRRSFSAEGYSFRERRYILNIEYYSFVEEIHIASYGYGVELEIKDYVNDRYDLAKKLLHLEIGCSGPWSTGKTSVLFPNDFLNWFNLFYKHLFPKKKQ